MEVELYEGLDRLPPYNEDNDTDHPPAEVTRLRDAIREADAVLISTPEYNGTVPGQIKHAVDWASRPYGQDAALWGKPIAVIGASATDYGAIWAQDHLRKALGIGGARVLEAELAIARSPDRFDGDGRLVDEEIARTARRGRPEPRRAPTPPSTLRGVAELDGHARTAEGSRRRSTRTRSSARWR